MMNPLSRAGDGARSLAWYRFKQGLNPLNSDKRTINIDIREHPREAIHELNHLAELVNKTFVSALEGKHAGETKEVLEDTAKLVTKLEHFVICFTVPQEALNAILDKHGRTLDQIIHMVEAIMSHKNVPDVVKKEFGPLEIKLKNLRASLTKALRTIRNEQLDASRDRHTIRAYNPRPEPIIDHDLTFFGDAEKGFVERFTNESKNALRLLEGIKKHLNHPGSPVIKDAQKAKEEIEQIITVLNSEIHETLIEELNLVTKIFFLESKVPVIIEQFINKVLIGEHHLDRAPDGPQTIQRMKELIAELPKFISKEELKVSNEARALAA